jgi:hypothetical protein
MFVCVTSSGRTAWARSVGQAVVSSVGLGDQVGDRTRDEYPRCRSVPSASGPVGMAKPSRSSDSTAWRDAAEAPGSALDAFLRCRAAWAGHASKPRQPAPSERHGLSQDQPFDQKQHPTTAPIEIRSKPAPQSASPPKPYKQCCGP